ncbi:MAG: hypothetical protein PHG85_02205 [Candidatus Altiarchaeota archaeon]|nr:hypothetical protein [Candidatus Altiarchaeota archaeon]
MVLVDRLMGVFRSREFMIFFVLLFIYLANPNAISFNDVAATRLLPISIIRERNLDLNEFGFLYENQPVLPYFLGNVSGRIVSYYPVFTAVLAVPVYILPVALGLDPQSTDVFILSRLSAALMTILSALFLYWTIRRMSGDRIASVITLVYSIGTANWFVSGQDLWQHGPGVLFIAVTLYLFERGKSEVKYVKYAGFALSWLVAVRPPNLLIALVLSAYVFMEYRREFWKFLLCAMPVAVMLLAYSSAYLHSAFLLGQLRQPTEIGTMPLLDGLMALLFSPNRGLFVFSPALILSIAGIAYEYLGKKGSMQMRYYSIAVAAAVLLWSTYWGWHGGACYGPRVLIETLPFLCVFLVVPVEKMLTDWKLKAVLAALIALSVFINFIGVAAWDGSWEASHGLDYGRYLTHDVSRADMEYVLKVMWDAQDVSWIYYSKKFFAHILRAITF